MRRGAATAGPPSPFGELEGPMEPLPATVLMMPAGVNLRMRLLSESEMYTLPAASTAMALGPDRSALVAGPPSPPKPEYWVPAILVTTPAGVTLYTWSYEQT